MIVVQDRIEVDGTRLGQVLQLFHEGYIQQAAQRGLHFVESLVSPPLKLEDAPNTLWLRWHVADVGAWWAMRAQSGDPAVGRFWANVDTLCLSRERIYLTEGATNELPSTTDVSEFIAETYGYRETAQLALKDSIDDAQRAALESALREAAAALPGLKTASLSANFAPEYAAGHYTWDLMYPDSQTGERAQQSPEWTAAVRELLTQYCTSCHALRLETISAGLRRPGLTNGIKRTAYFRLLPGTTTETAQRFERDLLEMTGQITQILNWRLSRACTLPWDTAGCAPWTYVWEQEYQSLDDLLGPYMAHPHHWAHIDRWFDPESGMQAVDEKLSHAFCALENSIITQETQ